MRDRRWNDPTIDYIDVGVGVGADAIVKVKYRLSFIVFVLK